MQQKSSKVTAFCGDIEDIYSSSRRMKVDSHKEYYSWLYSISS